MIEHHDSHPVTSMNHHVCAAALPTPCGMPSGSPAAPRPPLAARLPSRWGGSGGGSAG